MIGFKIVRTHNNEYLSGAKRGEVKYSLNKWTQRGLENGPLAVFRKREHAFSYWDHKKRFCMTKLCLFECEYDLSSDQRVWVVRDDGKVVHTPLCHLPEGTVLADKVRLLKEIVKQ